MGQQEIFGAPEAPVPADAAELHTKALAILEKAGGPVTITTQAEHDAADAILGEGAALDKAIGQYREEERAELEEKKRAILALRTRMRVPVEKVRAALEPAILEWRRKERARLEALAIEDQKRRQKEAEDARLRQAEQLEAEGRPMAAQQKVAEPVYVAPALIPKAPTGAAVGKKTWKGRIVDLKLVPVGFLRRVCKIDQSMLNTVAKAQQGLDAPPGVEFYQEEGLAVRAGARPVKDHWETE